MVRKYRLMSAAVAAALGMGAGLAVAAEPASQDLQEQIRQLQAKVQQLESRQDQATTQHMDAAIDRVIRDTDRRSQLLAMEGFTAGYTADRGFVLRDAAGDFLLHPYLQMQFRNVTNYRADAKHDGEDSDIQNGFEMRRMKFGFEGNLWGPGFTYTFQWATDRKTGTPTLEDAWAKYRFAPEWAVMAGQFKDPFAHESLVSSMRQLAADRSLLSQILQGNDNYVQGISLVYDNGDRLKASVAFTDGFNSSNNNFQDPPTNSFNFGVAGRVEYLAIGDPKTAWKQYSDFTAMGNPSNLLVLGGAFDMSQSGDSNALLHTVDAQWEPEAVKGLSVYGAYVGRSIWRGDQPAGVDDSFYDWGFLVQAGYMLNKNWEVFGRLDYTKLDDDFAAASIEDNIYELTGGINYYFKGHNAKITADLTWLPNGSPIGADGIGVLSQTNDKDQVVARIQFQLVL